MAMKYTDRIAQQSSFSFEVQEVDSTMRLDQFIVRQFPSYTRSFFKKLIASDCITINNKKIEKSGVRLRTGDHIVITFPAHTLEGARKLNSENFQVPVIFEHEHFLIINKPVGLVTHSPSAHSSLFTLVDWIVQRYENMSAVGYVDRPGIVHRLDKNTSGLLIIARTNYAHAFFSNGFKERTITKTYRAFVHGHPPRTGSIDLLIGRDPINKIKMIAVQPDSAVAHSINTLRTACTQYEVIQYFSDYTLVNIKPITGRTHQIRAHFQALGHPLLGDVVYGGTDKYIKRHALHAHSLAFYFEEDDFFFELPMPEDMLQLMR
jgi:23S rRNA pseudouridine1911/1915/1917 synthase